MIRVCVLLLAGYSFYKGFNKVALTFVVIGCLPC